MSNSSTPKEVKRMRMNLVLTTLLSIAQIQRIGINIDDNALFVEYFNHRDYVKYIRKITLNQELLMIDNETKLNQYLQTNEGDLFSSNGPSNNVFIKLLQSIDEFKRERILKLGTEKEINAEKSKMDKIFKKNVIDASNDNYIYDKRMQFEMNESEKEANEWDLDMDDEDDNDLLNKAEEFLAGIIMGSNTSKHNISSSSSPSRRKSGFKSFYKLDKQIGCGGFAAVHKCTRGSSDYAVKIMNKRHLSQSEMVSVKSEIKILHNIKHPNIVRLIEVFVDNCMIFMVMELCNDNDLFYEITSSENGYFCQQRSAKITYSLSNALTYLHKRGIVHRDLKLENILIGRDGSIKITDFGLAAVCPQNDARKKLLTACGSVHYVAPEIISKNGYGKECDMWSLGVVLYVMLCGYLPFDGETNYEIYQLIKAADYSFDSREWNDVSADAKHLICQLLEPNIKKRYAARHVEWHPWIVKYIQ